MQFGKNRRKTSNETHHPEGREHARLLLNLPIEYNALDSDITHSGHTYDLSPGGVMVNVPERLHIGQRINLEIFFSLGSSLDTIKASSQVVWVDETQEEGSYRLGMKFLDLSATDRSKLEKFFEKLARHRG